MLNSSVFYTSGGYHLSQQLLIFTIFKKFFLFLCRLSWILLHTILWLDDSEESVSRFTTLDAVLIHKNENRNWDLDPFECLCVLRQINLFSSRDVCGCFLFLFVDHEKCILTFCLLLDGRSCCHWYQDVVFWYEHDKLREVLVEFYHILFATVIC